MIRASLLGSLLSCLLLTAVLSAAEPAPEFFTLQVKLIEKAPPPSKPVVLSQPMISSIVGKKFDIFIGGQIPADEQFGGEPLNFGTRLGGIFVPSPGGQFQLQMTLDVGHQLAAEDKDLTVVHHDVIEVRMNLPQKKLQVIPISPKRYLELRVETAAEAQKREQNADLPQGPHPKTSATPSTGN